MLTNGRGDHASTNPTRILRKHSCSSAQAEEDDLHPSELESYRLRDVYLDWTDGYIGEDAKRPMTKTLEFAEDAGVVLAYDFAFALSTTAACIYKLPEYQRHS